MKDNYQLIEPAIELGTLKMPAEEETFKTLSLAAVRPICTSDGDCAVQKTEFLTELYFEKLSQSLENLKNIPKNDFPYDYLEMFSAQAQSVSEKIMGSRRKDQKTISNGLAKKIEETKKVISGIKDDKSLSTDDFIQKLNLK